VPSRVQSRDRDHPPGECGADLNRVFVGEEAQGVRLRLGKLHPHHPAALGKCLLTVKHGVRELPRPPVQRNPGPCFRCARNSHWVQG